MKAFGRYPRLTQYSNSRLEICQQEADGITAHDTGYFIVVKADCEQGVDDEAEPGSVEGRLDGAVVVGAEGDVVDARNVNGVADGAGDGGGVRAASGHLKIGDADDAAGAGDAAEVVITEIADIVAGAFDAAVRDDDGAGREGEDVVDGFRRCVGDVDEHAPGFHAAEHCSSEIGETALLRAGGGTGELRVEEVRGRHHAEAGVVHDVHILDVSFKDLGTLDAEESGSDGGVGALLVEIGLEIGGGMDDAELSLRTGGEAVQTGRLIEGAAFEAEPGSDGPALGDGEREDVIGVTGVALEVLAARRFGDDGEGLERDIGFDQAGDVDVTARAVLQEVAGPEEGVGVEVDDLQGLLERLGAGGDVVRRLVGDRVH